MVQVLGCNGTILSEAWARLLPWVTENTDRRMPVSIANRINQSHGRAACVARQMRFLCHRQHRCGSFVTGILRASLKIVSVAWAKRSMPTSHSNSHNNVGGRRGGCITNTNVLCRSQFLLVPAQRIRFDPRFRRKVQAIRQASIIPSVKGRLRLSMSATRPDVGLHVLAHQPPAFHQGLGNNKPHWPPFHGARV